MSMLPSAFRRLVRDRLKLAASRDEELSLALIEIKGVIEARRNLPVADMEALHDQIQILLAHHGVDGAATALTAERFAIIHERPEDLDELLQVLGGLTNSVGSGLVTAQSVKLSPQRAPLQQSRAVYAALDSFVDAGLSQDEADLRRSFFDVLDHTTRSAERLDTIIKERRFDLYFQPIVNLGTEAVVSHEALIRLEKFVGPAHMLNLAEDLDMIERLDALVAEQAVQRLCAPGSEALKLAINISGRTLLSDTFLEWLLSASSNNSELCSRLQLEIIESAILQDLEAASRRIRALRDAGFQVAIDDFAASATSFEYLRALPVSVVKLDGQYVRGVHRDKGAQAVVRLFVGLCNELKLLTVAEMIEREEELSVISALGVACGQGWVFGRPAPEPGRHIRKAAAPSRGIVSADSHLPVGVRDLDAEPRRSHFGLRR
jgi:EAL domain-containing protein (putative c-di-GMP-specific phosphodiesterase class I)